MKQRLFSSNQRNCGIAMRMWLVLYRLRQIKCPVFLLNIWTTWASVFLLNIWSSMSVCVPTEHLELHERPVFLLNIWSSMSICVPTEHLDYMSICVPTEHLDYMSICVSTEHLKLHERPVFLLNIWSSMTSVFLKNTWSSMTSVFLLSLWSSMTSVFLLSLWSSMSICVSTEHLELHESLCFYWTSGLHEHLSSLWKFSFTGKWLYARYNFQNAPNIQNFSQTHFPTQTSSTWGGSRLNVRNLA